MQDLYSSFDAAVVRIADERRKQELFKQTGRFKFSCADLEISQSERLAVLAEEFGEVAHEIAETIGGHAPLDRVKLRKELVQTAAVCVAWLQGLDAEDGKNDALDSPSHY